MTVSSKRAEHISLMSLILSVVFFAIAYFLGRWSGFFAIFAVSWLMLSTALVWLVLLVQFHQRSLAEQETLDTGQMDEGQRASTIFQAKGGHEELFTVARERLRVLEKWFLPIFSCLIAICQLGLGLYLLYAIRMQRLAEPQQPLACAVWMTAIAFVSFLMSRYTTGMSAAQIEWKPLRAGGSLLLSIAILCFTLAIGLALAQFKMFICVKVLQWIITVLLVVIGAETAMNVIFDIYRPRLKDQYSRSAFDSRLLGVINEPGGILHSAAGAIDYQFGFKVSQTWFYKLLEKAIVPLVLFGGMILYLLSCFVVVAPMEEAIIEHFGNPLDNAGNVRRAEPGLTVKWPWPIDIAYKYPTKKVAEINIGFIPKADKGEGKVGYGPLLWGQTHYEEEHTFLVASEQSVELTEGAAPVSLIIAAVPIQYKIKDLYSFIYKHKFPKKLLENICYRELTKFAAGATIEVDTPEQLNNSLFGAGRAKAKQILTERIQKAVDDEELGIEILFLGLQGIHPPPEVAGDYQKVVAAVQQKQTLIFNAQAERNAILSNLAGSVEEVEKLQALASQYLLAEKNGETEDIDQLGRQLDMALAGAKGEIFKILRQAQSHSFEKPLLAEATGKRFRGQLKAYYAAKNIYTREQRLMALEESLGNTRKYIVVADQNDVQIFRIDLQEKLSPGLYDVIGFEEISEK